MTDIRKPEIIVLSIPSDAHTSAIAWGLRKFGVDVEVIFPGNLPSHASITLEQVGSRFNAIYKEPNGPEIHTNETKVVWSRRIGYPPPPEDVHEHDRMVAERSYRYHIENLRAALHADTILFNDPGTQSMAGKKILQLATAARAGFRIPKTRVTNNFEHAKQWQEAHQDLVSKMYFTFTWRKDEQVLGAFTRKMDPLTEDDRAAIELCPNFFQEAIDAKSEVRMIAFGDELFALEMAHDGELPEELANDSLRDSRLYLQYRTYTSRKIDIPEDVAACALAYMKHLGLRYGAFDFIVDQNDEWVFLECNEGGQFLFLEDEDPEIHMLDRFVRFLARLAGYSDSDLPAEILHLADHYESKEWAERDLEYEKNNKFSPYTMIIEEDGPRPAPARFYG